MWYWFVILVLISTSFIAIGIFMIYSAITRKGIPHPGEKALLQFKTQHRMRGLIGTGMLIVGLIILYATVNEMP